MDEIELLALHCFAPYFFFLSFFFFSPHAPLAWFHRLKDSRNRTMNDANKKVIQNQQGGKFKTSGPSKAWCDWTALSEWPRQ